jgi:dihydroxy-acid dehydratase
MGARQTETRGGRSVADVKPVSRDVTDGYERAPARAMLRAIGMGDDD